MTTVQQFEGFKYHPIDKPDSFVDKYQSVHYGNDTTGYDDACKIKNDNLKAKLVSKDCKECERIFKYLNESADKKLEANEENGYSMDSIMVKQKTEKLEKIFNEIRKNEY